ncbi:MAG TPA: hypothetical protein VHF89_09750 [Solirubrobacteraceae bacterium]|nr:hypothetical protein [Solirubrobacteraceae bacterium]
MKVAGGVIGWATVGALVGVGVPALLSIGPLLLLLAAGLAIALHRAGLRATGWVFVGVGLALVVLGFLALPWRSCATGPSQVVARPGETASGSCGGIHPAVFLALGAGAIAAPILDRLRARRRVAAYISED